MNRYRVYATLESAVAIRRDRQSERSGGVQTIGGTLVRGALAQLYLQQHGEPDDVFHRLFLDECACRFGPLDPGQRICPLTAVACKREGSKHGIVDQLWFRLAQHWLGGTVPENVETRWRHCGHVSPDGGRCGADMKPHTGFWTDKNGAAQEAAGDRHSVAAHVGIDRATGTAAESVFYTLEALNPSSEGASLFGWLVAEDDALRALQQLLEQDECVVDIGHHRTRGYGRVRLDVDPTPETVDPSAVQNEWEIWNHQFASFLSKPPFSVPRLEPEQDFFFSLSLPTGAIVVDDVLRYSLDPASLVSWLPPLPNPEDGLKVPERPTKSLLSGGELRSIAAVAKHERVRGWNTAHGLPRQDEWAIERGSVYAYWFRGTSEQRETLKADLWQLCQGGIGLRRNEGFGVVAVSDDFHRRFC